MCLAVTLSKIALLESHTDIDSRNWSVAIRAFFALFFNTGCLVLLVNAALPTAAGTSSFLTGTYTSFDVRWQATVGTSIVLTMIINSFTVHMSLLTQWCCSCRCCLCCNSSARATQHDLDAALAPVEFPFAIRLATVINTCFTCFVYATGHPILYLVATGSILLAYGVDR